MEEETLRCLLCTTNLAHEVSDKRKRLYCNDICRKKYNNYKRNRSSSPLPRLCLQCEVNINWSSTSIFLL